MKILLKLGGTLLDDPAIRGSLAAQIAALPAAGVTAAIVHGGGKQMTRYLAERGVESRFVNGLRVTSPEIIDAVVKVFAGSVNKDLVGALRAAGAPAVGLCGIDGGLAEAATMDPRLGAVGRITGSNPAVLDALSAAGFLPVVACVAGGPGGAVFNVNADQMAVACAGAWCVSKLLFLTDVDGVRDASGATVPVLSAGDARALIDQGVATGGMRAKLESALAAIQAGIAEVLIAPGAAPDVLTRLLAGEPLGTRLVPEAQ